MIAIELIVDGVVSIVIPCADVQGERAERDGHSEPVCFHVKIPNLFQLSEIAQDGKNI